MPVSLPCLPSSPNPFFQMGRRGVKFKIPRPVEEGFWVRVAKLGCSRKFVKLKALMILSF
jgi:hypothetical protein